MLLSCDMDHGSAPWCPAVQTGRHDACARAAPRVREVVRAECVLCFGGGIGAGYFLFSCPSHLTNHLTMVCEIFKKTFYTTTYPSPNYECYC